MRERKFRIGLMLTFILPVVAKASIVSCEPMPEVVEVAMPEYPANLHHFKGGRIVVEFTLYTDGTVRDPEIVESNIQHRGVEELYVQVRAEAASWRFKKPSQVCRGRMPITFQVKE